MDEEKVFQELGLSVNESKAYQALVEHGKLSAAEVSAKGGIPYGKIYPVLDSLINKALVKIIPEKTKKFAPSDPESFIKLIEEKEKKINEAKEKVKELKRFYDVKEKQPVVVGVGKKGFYKIVSEMTRSERYAYNIKWTAEPRPDWLRDRKNSLRRKVKRLDLVRYDSETERNVREWLKVGKDIRKIENEGVAFSVVDDNEVMIALIKSNVTLLIKDRPFAKIMKRMFEETYEGAEEIK
jgi:sugar-specific transcriptional regulator TrmB